MDLMIQPLRRYVDFEGRARRAEYWLFQLLMVLIFMALAVVFALLAAAVPEGDSAGGPGVMVMVWIYLVMIIGVLLFIPSLAVSVRRLHDIGLSGFWLLIGLIPLGGFVLLVMSLIEGTRGPNKYGADPKGEPGQPPIVQPA